MLWIFLFGACSDKSNDSGVEQEALCSEPAAMECEDALVLDLGLQNTVSDGAISTSSDGDGFLSLIDASAGGYQQAPSNPWVYVAFTDDGLEKIEISDEDALESMDWDLSFRRFIIRLNGGSSGPGCTGAAVFFEDTYESLDSVPEGVPYVEDNYYTPDCTIINDSSGLPNNPQTSLGPWWEYPNCVATTGYPFLIQKNDGRVVKFVVDSYYGEGQDSCNSNGTPGSDSANFQIRWAFMD